jgi:DNA-damage-inducible protein J
MSEHYVDPRLEREAADIFSLYGLSLDDAIKLFLHKSILVGGLPFDLRQDEPNEKTIQAMQDVIEGKNLGPVYDTVEELMEAFEKEMADEANEDEQI